MSMRNPLANVLGHGSAKSGTHHWWVQRLTAIALVPLTIWLMVVLTSLGGATHEQVSVWMANPLNAGLLIAWILAMLHHAQLGLQVIIEDYIHTPAWEITAHVVVKLLAALGAIIATIAILRVVFGG